MNRCSSILVQPSCNRLRPLHTLKKTALTLLTCMSLLFFCTQSQAFASDDEYAISDNSYDLAQYVATAKAQQAKHITIGVDFTTLGNVNFDWKINLIEGYKKTGIPFLDEPRRSILGKLDTGTQEIHFSHPDEVTLKNVTIASQARLVVESGSHVIFEDVIFENKPIIKGVVEFRNCTFEAGAVVFEGGDATYTNGTAIPSEEGNKGGAHLPLSMLLSKTHAEGAIEQSVNIESVVTLNGSNKDRAQLNVVTPENMLGLSASIQDKKLVISGTPNASGELNIIVRASAEAGDGHEADTPVEQHFILKIYPKVSLELKGELPATARYERLYQRALKLMVKIGDAEPVDAYTYWTTDPDGRSTPKPQVITTPELPEDAQAYWLYDGVAVSSNLPTASGVFKVKVRMQLKGQTVESNEVEFRIWEGNETLKQQLDTFWTQQGKPARWLAEPYSIQIADNVVIPRELKVLMGSDCHNSEEAKKESDAAKEKEKEAAGLTPASYLFKNSVSHFYTDALFTHKGLSQNNLLDQKTHQDTQMSSLFKRISERLTSSYKNIDGITMASGGGSSGGISGGGGVGGSGSCQYLELGKSETGAYATDSIIIPEGTDVEFLNVKVKSSIKIIVQKGGKLTLNDSAVHGLIEVEAGGTLSGKYSSSTNGKIIFKDGSRMENLEIKSLTNHIREDDKTKPTPESVVEIQGHVTAAGANKFLGDSGAPGKDQSQTAVKLTEGSKLTIEKGATVEALGGNSEPYSKGGGHAVEMAEGSTIDGKGTLIAKGGSGYEALGGGGVIGNGTIANAKATITGGDGKSIIGHESPGGFGINGAITVDRTTKLSISGGAGVDKTRQPVDPTPAFNAEFPDPHPQEAVKLRVRHVDAISADAVTGASLKDEPDLKTLEYNVGDVIPLSAIVKPIDGYKLVKIRLHDHRHGGKPHAAQPASATTAPANSGSAELNGTFIPASFGMSVRDSLLIATNPDPAPVAGPQPKELSSSVNTFGVVMDPPETLTLDINDMVVELFYEKQETNSKGSVSESNTAYLYTQADNALRKRETTATEKEEETGASLIKRYLPKTGQERSAVIAIIGAAAISLVAGMLLYRRRSRS